jgi:hypothetical protein
MQAPVVHERARAHRATRPAGATLALVGIVCACGLAWIATRTRGASEGALATPKVPDVASSNSGAPFESTAVAYERSGVPSSGSQIEDDAGVWSEFASSKSKAAPRKEREFFARFSALADDALAAEVRPVLASDGPNAEKVALLRAVLERRLECTSDAFASAVGALPDASGAWGESVPRTALRLLRERAARDPLAREILERIAWKLDPPAPEALRRLAVASSVSFSSASDLRRIAPTLLRETEPQVRLSAWEALAAHPDVDYAGWLQAQLDCAPPPAAPPATVIE